MSFTSDEADDMIYTVNLTGVKSDRAVSSAGVSFPHFPMTWAKNKTKEVRLCLTSNYCPVTHETSPQTQKDPLRLKGVGEGVEGSLRGGVGGGAYACMSL